MPQRAPSERPISIRAAASEFKKLFFQVSNFYASRTGRVRDERFGSTGQTAMPLFLQRRYLNEESDSRQKNWVHLRDLMAVLVARDFKVRYKRSVLGIAWSLLVPLAQLAVLYVVFNNMLRLNIPHFSSFLLTGILPWTWFQSSLMTSSTAIVENRELVKQVGFPVGVLPCVSVLSQLVHFLLAMPILAGFLLADGFRPTFALLALPIVMIVQFFLSVSAAYILATLQVKFRDTQYLLGIFLFLFFYVTPVFWDGSSLPPAYAKIMNFNPVAGLLNGYRDILMRGQWPDVKPMAAVAFMSSVLAIACFVLFLRARDRFVEEL
jgi:lipopolysaccharide transport system permease protein